PSTTIPSGWCITVRYRSAPRRRQARFRSPPRRSCCFRVWLAWPSCGGDSAAADGSRIQSLHLYQEFFFFCRGSQALCTPFPSRIAALGLFVVALVLRRAFRPARKLLQRILESGEVIGAHPVLPVSLHQAEIKKGPFRAFCSTGRQMLLPVRSWVQRMVGAARIELATPAV